MSYAKYKTGYYNNAGTIIGQSGIYFSGNNCTLVNTGSIEGTLGIGVRLEDGGRVTNTGTISGSFEGVSSAAAINMFNTGTITGADWGVVSAGGTVNSSGDGFTTDSRISGGIDGVLMTAYGTVGNGYGSIVGNRFGVNLQNGGTVDNDIGGIRGGTTAIYISGAAGTLINNGIISGGLSNGGDGVNLLDGGEVTNDGGGRIYTNGGDAIYSNAIDQSGIVTNAGIIGQSGDRGAGIYLKGSTVTDTGGGDVFNQAGGTIRGYIGVSITNSGYVSNAGYIDGTGTQGVNIQGSGDIRNQAGGTITGATYGVLATGNDSEVGNSGAISAQLGVVLKGASGFVTNYAGGTITGLDGVDLTDGGSVFNEKSGKLVGTITGSYNYGVIIQYAPGYVNNAGVIKSFHRAIEFADGGIVVNQSGGKIDGYGGAPGRGVTIYGAAGTINNAGTIAGAAYYGVQLSAGGSLANKSTGFITGGLDGVHVTGAAATVTNAGSIAAVSRNGVYLGAGGTVTNTGGSISGTTGVFLADGGSVVNQAHLVGSSYGAVFSAGGTVTNKSGGTIDAKTGVLVVTGSATVTNAGTITGSTYAVHFAGGTDTLVIDPGAVFNGLVKGAGSSALVLASGAATGSISGLGTAFTGFGTLTENSGAKWSVAGNNSLGASAGVLVQGSLTVAGTLTSAGAAKITGSVAVNAGESLQLGPSVTIATGSTLSANATGRFEIGTTGGAAAGAIHVDAGATLTGAGMLASPVFDAGLIKASGGTLAITGALAGSGTLDISSGATASITGTLASGTKLTFLSGGHEEAVFGAPTGIGALISGFTLTTDMMDLTGFAATSESFSGHTLTLETSGGSFAHIQFTGSYTSSDFSIGSDGHGGNLLKFV